MVRAVQIVRQRIGPRHTVGMLAVADGTIPKFFLVVGGQTQHGDSDIPTLPDVIAAFSNVLPALGTKTGVHFVDGFRRGWCHFDHRFFHLHQFNGASGSLFSMGVFTIKGAFTPQTG